MISIEMNKDIEKYKTGNFKGLTAKEAFFAGLTLFLGVGIVFASYIFFKIPVQIGVYLVLPIVIPTALMGFYQLNEMTFLETVKRMWQVLLSKPYVYQAEEYQEEKPIKKKIKKKKIKKKRSGVKHGNME